MSPWRMECASICYFFFSICTLYCRIRFDWMRFGFGITHRFDRNKTSVRMLSTTPLQPSYWNEKCASSTKRKPFCCLVHAIFAAHTAHSITTKTNSFASVAENRNTLPPLRRRVRTYGFGYVLLLRTVLCANTVRCKCCRRMTLPYSYTKTNNVSGVQLFHPTNNFVWVSEDFSIFGTASHQK